jgi:hypothetical protein
MNYIYNNDLTLYTLSFVTVSLITGYFIKSYFYSPVIICPNSPTPTFNFTQEQLKEINDNFDTGVFPSKYRGGEMDQETKDKLDHDFQTMLGENADEFNREIEKINDEFMQELQNVFDNFDFSEVALSGIDLYSFLYISIIAIIFKLSISLYKLAYCIPFTMNKMEFSMKNKISYLEEFLLEDQNNIFFFRKSNISRFYFADPNEISDFLMNLDKSKTYVVSFDLVID